MIASPVPSSTAYGITALLLALAFIGCQEQPEDQPPSPPIAQDTAAMNGQDAAPRDTADWQIRFDQASAQRADLTFQPDRDTIRISSGPAAIYYHPTDTATAPFTAHATFTQLQQANNPESYGLFFGGQDLQGEKQRYTYFLVRQNGEYLIKRRNGSSTSVIQDWTTDPAVRAFDTVKGRVTNELAVSVGPDSVHFQVNGAQVDKRLRSEIPDLSGQVGLRVNHRLDLAVTDFRVTPSVQ